jgi:hypothetical protein
MGGGSSLPVGLLVHHWLSAMTDSITHTTAPRPVATLADTTRRPARLGEGGGVGNGAGRRPADDPRVPAWIQQAIPALVAGYPDPDFASAQLARQKDKLIPLHTLLTEQRPEGDRGGPMAGGRGPDERRGSPEDGGGFGGGRMGGGPPSSGRSRSARTGGGTLQGSVLFDTEALSVADYLADREGPEFVGSVFRTLASGATFEDALRGAHSVAHDLDGFERGWRGWLDAQAGKVEDQYR